MEALLKEHATKHVPLQYLKQGIEAKQSYTSDVKLLLEKGQCPQHGWRDIAIENLLNELAMMDSNNFSHNAGVGEREARIFSNLVTKRHFHLGHGIGRSGDLTEVQPKAAGSSLLYKITNSMSLDLIKVSGGRNVKASLIVPMATGMSIALCFQTIRKERKEAQYVIWPRIDQKSCFKSISCAGYEAIVVENVLEGDELRTDINKIKECMTKYGSKSIAAVLTTTSCFAPRGIDKLEEVAQLCKDNDIPHIINNAYGLQSSKCMHHIEQAARLGRVDAFIQSTDKNLMVPVGGAIIAGYDKSFINRVSKTYPGRASGSPILDVFITLLSMGTDEYKRLLVDRKQMKLYLTEKMLRVANDYNLRVLQTKNNPISIALSLPKHFGSELGSMLFIRGVSGTRVLVTTEEKTIDDFKFTGWGAHTASYPEPYVTAAASIGMERKDVDLFVRRLDKCLSKLMGPNKSVTKGEDEAAIIETSATKDD